MPDYTEEQPLDIDTVPELSDKQKQQYKNRYGNDSFLQRTKKWFRRTWNGKNKEGKYLGLGLDVGESFLPDIVSRIRDIIQNKTQPKTDTDMNFLKDLKRRLKQPSGKAVLTVIAVVATYFGADINAEALGETLVVVIQGVCTVIAGATALYEMFRDEDKAK